jgi:NADH-quinone oxidoreductase subunit C
MASGPETLFERIGEVLAGVSSSAVVQSKRDRDELSFTLARPWLRPAVVALRDADGLRFDMLSDITAIDYLFEERLPRFDVVYHLYSLPYSHRVRLKVPVEEEDAEVDSLCGLWSGANFMEREVYDMFGIRFRGHPDLRRILMPEDWVGHPLRKDFPLGASKSFYFKREVQEYAGEPKDLVPRIRVQDGDV